MANITIQLNPVVALVGRRTGYFGIAEQIAVTCTVRPASESVASLGGVSYKVVEGSGRISAAAPAAGTATFTCGASAEKVSIAAHGVTDPTKELGRVSFSVVAPTGLSFKRIGTQVMHTNGSASAGFRANIFLEPPGVSYQNLEIREGEFKGKGTGYYAAQQGMVHPATNPPVAIINGNQVVGFDTINSGIQPAPWSAGRFEWYIPWQYRILGTGDWVTFAYATHVEEINALGRVEIGKFNAGPFGANVNDPTVP